MEEPAEAPMAGTSKVLLGAAETLVKGTAIAVGIAAAMGLPAVNIHYARYSIPTALITYDEILRAGVLPTVALVLVTSYLYWVHKESRTFTPNSYASVLLQVVTWPILLPVLLVALTAFLAMYILLLWGALWLLTRPLSYLEISLTNRDLVKGAAALLVPVIFVLFWTIGRSGDETKTEPPPRTDDTAPQVERTDPFNHYMTMFRRSPREVPLRVLVVGILSFLIGFVIFALVVRAVVYLWEPAWSEQFTYWNAIGGAVIVGVLYFVSMLLGYAVEWLRDAESSKRIFGFVVVLVIVSAAYISLAAYYSYRIYPWLPRGFGGGRPNDVIVWVATGAAFGLPKSSACIPAAATAVRCEGLSLFLVDNERVVLVTRPGGSMEGVLLSRDDVDAIAWSQSRD